MTRDTRIALFLMGELVAALRANDLDAFKRWLSGGVQDLGEPVVEELLLDWLYVPDGGRAGLPNDGGLQPQAEAAPTG